MIEIINPYGFIYITTNLINGKKYIGQKKIDNSSRWKSYLGSGSYFMNSVKKYGEENFSREIIAIAYSLDELNDLETKFIYYHDAVISDDYYNRMEGGKVISALNRVNSVKVICIDNGKIFDSLVDASIYAGCSVTKIKSTFKKVHTSKYGKEELIFRLLKNLNKEDTLCSICGKPTKKTRRKRSLCKSCEKGVIKIKCRVCGNTFEKTKQRQRLCVKCSEDIKKRKSKARKVKYNKIHRKIDK